MDIGKLSDLIRDLGFPIVATVGLALAFWIVWKRLMKLYETQHSEHREDILAIMKKYEELVGTSSGAISNIVDSFRESQEESKEAQRKNYDLLERTHLNTIKILERRKG